MNLEYLSDILGYTGIGSSCLPILFCFFIYSNQAKKYPFRVLFFVSILYFVSNVLTLLLFLFTSVNQNLLINLHSSIEFFLLVIFYKWILKGYNIGRYLNFIIPLFLLILGATILNFGFNENYTFLNVSQKFGLLIFSLLYLYYAYNSSAYDKLTDSPYFWINVSVLLYNASSIYISIFENFLRDENIEAFYMLWPLLQISGICYYSLFSFGLWKLKN